MMPTLSILSTRSYGQVGNEYQKLAPFQPRLIGKLVICTKNGIISIRSYGHVGNSYQKMASFLPGLIDKLVMCITESQMLS